MCSRSAFLAYFRFGPKTDGVRSNYIPSFVRMPLEFDSTTFPLSFKCHRSLVHPSFLFHANAGGLFFRCSRMILQKPFGRSSNSLATLLLISFLILLRLFRLLSVAEGRWGGGAQGAVKQADERCGKGVLFYWHHKNKGRNGIVRPCVDGSIAGCKGSAISSS